MSEVKNTVLSSLFWKFLERGGTQGIQFIISIVLARLLSPEDYGIIALITIFIAFATIFVQASFSTALIQKKNTDQVDFSSVFYISLGIAAMLYILLFFTAPAVAGFYEQPLLVSVIRILALSLLLTPITSVQNAYIAKNMMFKKLFFSSLGATVVSGTVGVIMAYKGFGVWALVWQQIVSQLVITIILWFTVKWRPKLLFSIKRAKGLFSYGWKILIPSLIDRLDVDLRSLVIGKLYNANLLGFFNKGQQFPNLIVSNVNESIQSVLLPALSNEQDDRKRVKDIVRRSIVTGAFIIFPLMIGMAATSESLVRVLLTDKWAPCIPFMQILCFYYALFPMHTPNLQAINAIGRSDIFLRLEIIKKSIGFAILAITAFYNAYIIAWGVLINGIIAVFINIYPNRKLLNYGYIEQAKDILPPLLISLIMGVAVYCINFINLEPLPTLVIQVVLGAILYIGLSKIFKLECFNYLLVSIKAIFNNKFKKRN